MRIALVHDYFLQDGGAERVVLAWQRLFPRAPIYTLLSDPRTLPEGFDRERIRPSALQKLLVHPKVYPLLTPFMPMAVEQMDVRQFDRVLISTSSFAKGVIAPPHVKTICYMHTPTRFLWEERKRYAHDRGWPALSGLPIDHAFHRLRAWDYAAAQRPHQLLTNSRTSQARIARYYSRSAEIVSPPIDLATTPFIAQRSPRFWLTGGRLIPYKRFDLSIRAANFLHAPLKIFGCGPAERYLRSIAGPTVEFLGSITDQQKYQLMHQAYAFLHPHLEDFGMTALEALGSGTPVIAFDGGGAQETVQHGANGILLPTSSVASVLEAMRRFQPEAFDPTAVRESVRAFDLPRFEEQILRYVHAD